MCVCVFGLKVHALFTQCVAKCINTSANREREGVGNPVCELLKAVRNSEIVKKEKIVTIETQ